MRSLIVLCCLLIGCQAVLAQTTKFTYALRGDTVKVTNCDSAELVIENHTQGVPGFLFNTGNGRTIFKRAAVKLNDSMYQVGADTILLKVGSTNAWQQNGNSFGGSGFFGTVDNSDINFYTNNVHRAKLAAAGKLNVDSDMVVHGMTIGTGGHGIVHSTVLGLNADLNGPALDGTIAIGYLAANSMTGSGIAIGNAAGSNASGTGIMIGANAGMHMTGRNNIAIGDEALRNIPASGSYNTVLGENSALNLNSGGYNIIIGDSAGDGLTTGSYNTIIGNQLTRLDSGLSNSIIIGDGQGNRRLFVNSKGDLAVDTTYANSLLQVHRQYVGPGIAYLFRSDSLVVGVSSEFTNTFKVGDSITLTLDRRTTPDTIVSETQRITAILADDTLHTTPFSLATNFSGTYYTRPGNVLSVKGNGRVGVNNDHPTSTMDVTSPNGYNQLRLRTSYTPVSSSDANGNVGDISWDGNYIYVKTPTGWKRSALTNF